MLLYHYLISMPSISLIWCETSPIWCAQPALVFSIISAILALIRSSLFDPILLLQYDLFSMIRSTQILSILSDLIWSYLIWSDLVWFYLIWSDLILSFLFDLLTPLWSYYIYSTLITPIQSNPICLIALTCSALSIPLLVNSIFASNNLPLRCISPSYSTYYNIEVINNPNMDFCHHLHDPPFACCKCFSLLVARNFRKSGKSIFQQSQILAKPGTFFSDCNLYVYTCFIFRVCDTGVSQKHFLPIVYRYWPCFSCLF